jgi:hypothetical protein
VLHADGHALLAAFLSRLRNLLQGVIGAAGIHHNNLQPNHFFILFVFYLFVMAFLNLITTHPASHYNPESWLG